MVRAALPVAADAPMLTAARLRKFMESQLGWEEAWADTIVSDLKKRRVNVTPTQMETVVRGTVLFAGKGRGRMCGWGWEVGCQLVSE